MIELVTAGVRRLTEDATLRSLLGDRIYHGSATGSPDQPYLTVRYQASGNVQQNTGPEQIEQPGLRFQAFAPSDMQAARVIRRVEALMAAAFPMPDGRIMIARKRADDLFEEPDRNTDGQVVWQGVLDVEYTIHRNPKG